MSKKLFRLPRKIILIWALGVISICLLLTFGPVSAFRPEKEPEEVYELTDGENDEFLLEETASENREELLQIFLICAAMSGMLFFALFLWGEPDAGIAAYVVICYILCALPMTKGGLFAAAILLDHAAFMLWAFLMPRLKEEIKKVAAAEYVYVLLNAYLFLSGFCLIRYYGGVDNIDFVTYINPANYITGFVAAFHILFLIRLIRRNRYTTSRMLIVGAFFFSFACVLNHQDVYFAAGLVLILAFLTYYLVKDQPGMFGFIDRREDAVSENGAYAAGYRRGLIAVMLLSLIPIIYFSEAGIYRYRTFHAANYDLGIFAQMYSYMAKTGLPLTTTERGYLLSHFCVHLSPVLYLFLPIYMIFRSVESLLVMQAVIVFAGVIPLFMICRHYRLRPVVTFLVSCIYLVLPAIGQPLFFDFHENKFIPFFVLWFIYFYLEKKKLPALLFLLLSLMIKEDTSIFLMVFALYRIIGKKDYRRGGLLLMISAAWFAGAMVFIETRGQPLVEGHYSMYYMEGESGLFAMAKNIVLEPGRFLCQVFDRENLGYIFCTLGVFLFVPLFCRDKRRLILLIPYVAFALMTTYPSQHDVGYQYTYGPAVLILLLFIMNLRELDRNMQYVVCVTALCAGILFSYSYRGMESWGYFKEYGRNRGIFTMEEDYLADFPEDASVTADALIAAHLSNVREVYEYGAYDGDLIETDYYILFSDSQYRDFRKNRIKMGYQQTDKVGNLLIYEKKAGT